VEIRAVIQVAREMDMLPKQQLSEIPLDLESLGLCKWSITYRAAERLLFETHIQATELARELSCSIATIYRANGFVSKLKQDCAKAALKANPILSDTQIGRALHWSAHRVRRIRLALEKMEIIPRYRFNNQYRQEWLTQTIAKEKAGLRYVVAAWPDGLSLVSSGCWCRPQQELPFPKTAIVEWTPTRRRQLEHQKLAVLKAFKDFGLTAEDENNGRDEYRNNRGQAPIVAREQPARSLEERAG
jgi:hypothetical protein